MALDSPSPSSKLTTSTQPGDAYTYNSTDSEDSSGGQLAPFEDDPSLDLSSNTNKPFGLRDIPLSVYCIIVVELFERFSYYGLRALLTLFLKEKLDFSESAASALYSYFCSMSYFMPIFGGIIADSFLGRFWTICILTSVYVCGAFLLVYDSVLLSRWLIIAALLLVAIGTGSIKPNVSTFGAVCLRTNNPQAIQRYFSLFYAAINVGSVCSSIFLPIVSKNLGYTAAFFSSAIGLLTALVIFSSGYSHYVHVPPSGSLFKRAAQIFAAARKERRFVEQNNLQVSSYLALKHSSTLHTVPTPAQSLPENDQCQGLDDLESQPLDLPAYTPPYTPHWLDYAKLRFKAEHVEEIKSVLAILPIFPFIIFFWLCFDQQGSTFVLQAEKLDRNVFGIKILTAQVNAMNAILVLFLVPLFDGVIYPFCRRVLGLQLKHLNRMAVGLFLTSLAFICCASLDYAIVHSKPNSVHIVWQIPQYVIMTIAELLISITGLEFVYSQAPKSMKGTLAAMWCLTTAFGDLFAGILFSFIKLNEWQLSLLCASILFVVASLFIPFAIWFNSRLENFYAMQLQEFLHPGSCPPPKDLPDTEFEEISPEDREFLLYGVANTSSQTHNQY